MKAGRLVSEKAEADNGKRNGEVTLSGSMTRQGEQDFPLQDQASHIGNTGKMIEEMEIKMRNLLQEVRSPPIRPLSLQLPKFVCDCINQRSDKHVSHA